MTYNNPWGQGRTPNRPNRGANTPSEFDHFFSKLKDKFNDFFGGDNKGGNKNFLIFIFLLIICFIFWLLGGIYKVETSQQAVEMFFGRYYKTKTAGLRYHLPYPIQTVHIVDTEKDRELIIGARNTIEKQSSLYTKGDNRRYMFTSNQMLTGDENIVNIDFMVRWKINDPKDYLFNIKNPEDTVYAVSESVMREVVGKNKIDDLLTSGREAVQYEVKSKIQSTLNNYKTGVEISQVAIQNSAPPKPVERAFKDVQAARADAERFIEEATKYSNQIIPKAQGKADALIQNALGYKEKSVLEAQGETERFNQIYAEYKKAPYVTKKRLSLETIENVYKDKNKLFLSGTQGGGVLPLLPLQEFMKNKQ